VFQILLSSAVKTRDFHNNYLKSIYQPKNALINMQFTISIKPLHVSAAGCYPQSLTLVMNCIVLSRFVSWYISCEDVQDVNNVKYLKYLLIFFRFQKILSVIFKMLEPLRLQDNLVLKYITFLAFILLLLFGYMGILRT
jgi:hypothetical protein